MSLTDDLNQPRAFTFAPNTILAPHEYLVLIADRNIAAPDVHPGFQLSREGGVVALFDQGARRWPVARSRRLRHADRGPLHDRLDRLGRVAPGPANFGGPNQPVTLGDSAAYADQ